MDCPQPYRTYMKNVRGVVQGSMSKSHTMGGDLSLTVLFILDIMVNYCGTAWWTSLVVPFSAGRKLFSCRDIRGRAMQYINHVSFNTLDDAYSKRIAVVLTCTGRYNNRSIK